MNNDRHTHLDTDRQLDQLLAEWAKSDAVGAGDDAAVARMALHGEKIATLPNPASATRGQWRRLAGGGAIAALLVVALVSLTMPRSHQTRQMERPVQVAATATTADSSDDTAMESFMLLHVPTDEEEEMLI